MRPVAAGEVEEQRMGMLEPYSLGKEDGGSCHVLVGKCLCKWKGSRVAALNFLSPESSSFILRLRQSSPCSLPVTHPLSFTP